MKNVLFGFLLAVGLVALAVNVEANLILDSGFESGAMGSEVSPDLNHPWSVSGDRDTWQITSEVSHSGTYSLKYTGGAFFTDSVTQPWSPGFGSPLVPNTWYTFSFWLNYTKGVGTVLLLHFDNNFIPQFSSPFVNFTLWNTLWNDDDFGWPVIHGWLTVSYGVITLAGEAGGGSYWYAPGVWGADIETEDDERSNNAPGWTKAEIIFNSGPGGFTIPGIWPSSALAAPAYFDDFNISPLNAPPVADCKVGLDGDDLLILDGSGSSDPEGTIAYEWSIDGGVIATTAIVGTEDLEPGIYEATLTVTDNDGQTDSCTVTLVKPLGKDPQCELDLAAANACIDAINGHLGTTDCSAATLPLIYVDPGTIQNQQGMARNPNAGTAALLVAPGPK